MQTAEAAVNIANLLEEQKRIVEAYTYAGNAARAYQNVYEATNPNTIKVLWQQVSIGYALKEPLTEQHANRMVILLIKRDLLNSPFDA